MQIPKERTFTSYLAIAAGGGAPLHRHVGVAEVLYVLAGSGTVYGVKGESAGSLVEAGSAVYIPAGVPHSYRVLEAPFEFLCMVPNRDDEIRIVGADAAC